MRIATRRLLQFAAAMMVLFALSARAEDIVVVVPADSPVARLSKSQVINLFLGRFKQLPGEGRARPADLVPLKESFYRRLVEKTPGEISAYWARLVYSGQTTPPAQLASTEALVAWLKSTEGAIAYLPGERVDPRLKVVYELGGPRD